MARKQTRARRRRDVVRGALFAATIGLVPLWVFGQVGDGSSLSTGWGWEGGLP